MLHGRLRNRVGFMGSTVAAMGFLAAPAMVRGQDEAPINSGNISLTMGVDFVTQYFFRGLLQEDSGFIAQPYADVGLALYEGNNGINSIGLNLGIWNSVHSEETGSTGTADAWYEADLYASLSVGFADIFTGSLIYTAYTYPNGAFDVIHELSVKLAVDDSQWMGDFALSPYVLVAFELSDENGSEDVYLELGIAPGFTLIESKDYPVGLSFPIAVGLGLDDYYIDADGSSETFGYVSVGVIASVPLSFIPSQFGEWSLAGGVNFLFLGDAASDVNGGDDFEIIGKLSISMSY